MKIYTGRGDGGQTDLRNMESISKSSIRIEAYGSADEVNSILGVARPTGYEDVDECLSNIQNELHIVQAELATPDPDAEDPTITTDHVDGLESAIDRFQEELEPLERFVLPGGSRTGARLHHARAVCRRAERRFVGLEAAGENPNETVGVYLNRLSDVLFTLARVVNRREGISEENPSY